MRNVKKNKIIKDLRKNTGESISFGDGEITFQGQKPKKIYFFI